MVAKAPTGRASRTFHGRGAHGARVASRAIAACSLRTASVSGHNSTRAAAAPRRLI